MLINVELLDQFSAMLEYPQDTMVDLSERCESLLKGHMPNAAMKIADFREMTKGMSKEDLQELFIRTFDINPVCTLEVGWQLYGEQYARGEFLTKVRADLRAHEITESTELPDHLTHVLKLIGRMDDKVSPIFSEKYALPAVKKMMDGFKDKNNPYKNILSAIKTNLNSLCGQAMEDTRND